MLLKNKNSILIIDNYFKNSQESILVKHHNNKCNYTKIHIRAIYEIISS